MEKVEPLEKNDEQSEFLLGGRARRMATDFFGGLFGGAAVFTAMQIANDYLSTENVLDSDLAFMAALGAGIGGVAVGSSIVVKEGLDALLNREAKPDEDQGHSLIDSVKNIGSYARAGFVTGFVGFPAFVGLNDYISGETVLDADLLSALSYGAIGGTAIMGAFGIARESIGAILNKANLKAENGRSLLPYVAAGYTMGILGLPVLVGLNDYISGETVLDTDLILAAGSGGLGGAAIIGTYGMLKEGLGALGDKLDSIGSYKSDAGTEVSKESAIPAPEESCAEPQK